MHTAVFDIDLISLTETPTRFRFDTVLATTTGTYFLEAKVLAGDQFERAGLRSWLLALCRAALVPSTPDDAVSRMAPRDDALQAADDLRLWLGATYDDLQSITGIAKNTFHHWRRTGARPRPSTVRRLWRAHALVRALIARLGQDEAVTWLRTGPRAPLDTLFAGDLEAAEAAAHALLFRRPAARADEQEDYAPFRPEPEFEARGDAAAAPVRRASRRPRRGRLTEA
jgi:hypothetical protein